METSEFLHTSGIYSQDIRVVQDHGGRYRSCVCGYRGGEIGYHSSWNSRSGYEYDLQQHEGSDSISGRCGRLGTGASCRIAGEIPEGRRNLADAAEHDLLRGHTVRKRFNECGGQEKAGRYD